MKFLSILIASFSVIASEPNFRLYGKSQEFTLLSSAGKKVSFPSGTRATQSSVGLIIYNEKTNLYELYSEIGEILIKRKLPEPFGSCKINKATSEVFFTEARESIEQIKKSNRLQCERIYDYMIKEYPQGAKEYENCDSRFKQKFPDFASLLEKTNQRLIDLERNPKREKELKKKLKRHENTFFNKKNNMVKIKDFENIIFGIHNPEIKKEKYSDTTLIVPISFDWIKSHKKIKEWFDKEWIGRGIMSPFEGNSGEGVSHEDLAIMQKKLLELRDFSLALSFDSLVMEKKIAACPGEEKEKVSLSNSPEFKWLQKLDENKIKQNQRLIFIHDQTYLSTNAQWQSGIPVDQSLSCFRSDPVFSTLLHELNVNASPYLFFPDDTHGASSDKDIKEQILNQDNDLHEFKSLVTREHYLQLIYLAEILK